MVSTGIFCQHEKADLIKVSGHLGAIDKARQQSLSSGEYWFINSNLWEPGKYSIIDTLASLHYSPSSEHLFLSGCSDIGIGQSQDDSIVGLRQTKHIPPALPVSGTLSSSNPDLLQSHHRILDFNTTPGKDLFFVLHFIYIFFNLLFFSGLWSLKYMWGFY